jgi:uncharacterized protein
MTILEVLADAFKIADWQVGQTVQLIDAGNTIPFIARYRKEATGNLDDQVLRDFHERLLALRALQDRREEILRLIGAQERLTPELAAQIDAARTLAELDDLYPAIPAQAAHARLDCPRTGARAARRTAVSPGG